MYAEYLAHMGLTPLCVQEAHAALRLACRADVIVTGLLLPGPIDGFALIDRLRNGTGTRNIPIVVLTGCAWMAAATSSVAAAATVTRTNGRRDAPVTGKASIRRAPAAHVLSPEAYPLECSAGRNAPNR